MKEKIISVCTELKDVIDGIGAVQTAWGLIVACALIIAFVFCVFTFTNRVNKSTKAQVQRFQREVCANCTTGICRSCGLELGLNLCGNIKGNLQ